MAHALKDEIQDAYRAWLDARGFEPRRGQRQMIADVATGITDDDDRICVIEAGTGTGKTAGYCLAVIPVARANEKKIVVSTATIALQEQVLLKDLPDLARHTTLDFSYVLAKGRSRYVCLKRLDEALDTDVSAEIPLFDEPGSNDLKTYEAMATTFDQGNWDGELESWEHPIDQESWRRLTTDHRGCANNRCDFFQSCPFFRARGEVHEADIVVANHDLVLADLNLGGGVILPRPDETILVIDEAHHLPQKTQQHFTLSARVGATARWLDQVNTTLGTMTLNFGQPTEMLAITRKLARDTELVSRLLTELERLVASLSFSTQSDRNGISRFSMGRIPESIVELCEPLSRYFRDFGNLLEAGHAHLQELIDGSRNWKNAERADEWLPVVGFHINRASQSYDLFSDFAGAALGSPMCARWVIRHETDIGTDFECLSAPLDPGTILREILWQKCHAAVLTSATLCTMGSFERFLEQVGLGTNVRNRRIESPFEFGRIATLTIPHMSSDPRDVALHTEELGQLLPKLLELEISALVLFTSWRQMQVVTEALPASVLNDCHIQGKGSKQKLLSDHKEKIDGGGPSYLFGLASFSEGVDLPDDYCRHVIVAKLPFSVPDDPIDQAFAEWLESEGRNPFIEVSVPDATLKLIQACGRLIRHEEDGGRITILDRRLLTRGYGRSIIESLPPYGRGDV
ncbi:MAG: ATP-dependent DNA helicase DinG [Pseudomonadota bacterium]|nr:ATP-dependent DNA helicase DinG [Pseudomonadota bacterium]